MKENRRWIAALFWVWSLMTALVYGSDISMLSYLISNDEVIIIGCDREYTGAIDIPETIEGYPVTTIGSGAFTIRSRLTSVILPDSVTHIGWDAFDRCLGLTNMVIPNSVTTIGSGAFKGCTNLTHVTIGDHITSIGFRAFNNTGINFHSQDGIDYLLGPAVAYLIQAPSDLSGEFIIPHDVADKPVRLIAASALENLDSLIRLTIPDSVEYIGSASISRCDNLTDVLMANSVKTIGSYAFNDCTSLTNLTLGDHITSIGWNAFTDTGINLHTQNGVEYLLGSSAAYLIQSAFDISGDLIIPQYIEGKTVRVIAEAAFDNRNSLTGVTIPNGVTSIGYCAFRSCDSLTSISIPDSVASIGAYAFMGESLENVTIGKGVTHIGNFAFSGDNGAFNPPDSLESIIFEGNAPDSFGSGVFDFWWSEFTLYFYEGATGFSTPQWKSYPSEMLEKLGGFDDWVLTCPEGQRGPADCPDGDAVPNLIKYAAGLVAGTPCVSSNLFSAAQSNDMLVLTYWKGDEADDIELYPTTSGSLTNGAVGWATNGISNWATGETDTNGRAEWKAQLPSSANAGFLRLQAEQK